MTPDENSTLHQRWTRSPAAWAVAGAVTCLALALARFDPWLFTGGDNAAYYALARALATGEGYVSLYEPGAPPHVLYPPGFPVLLVPFHWATGGSLVAMKFAPILATGLLLWGTWRLARRDPAVPAWVAAAAVWVVGLYPVVQTYAHRVLSDLPYTAFVVAALAVLQGAASEEDDRVDRRWLAGCGLALAAFWIRVPGVTLLGAVVAWATLRRHWRRAAAAAGVFAAGALPWFLWSRTALSAGAEAEGAAVPAEYLGQVTGLAEQKGAAMEILENVRRAGVEYGTYQLPHLFWPVDPAPDLVRALGLVVGAAAIAWGAWRAIRSRGRPAPWEVYVPATLALLPLWPWLGDRFFLTIAPMLWLWILVALDDAARRLLHRRAVAVGAVAAVCAFLLVAQAKDVPDRIEGVRTWMAGDLLAGYDVFWRDYFEAARWMRANVPEDAVVLARKPSLVWYWSRRPVVLEAFTIDGPAQWTAIRREGATHMLIEPWAESHLRETLATHREDLEMAFRTESGQVAVLAVAPPSGGP